ncbi:MAG: hypothetical protein NPIRA01_27250 [Nitrospirales bacterium]|nr:MAG: hypothetical protein NPIRA01_27250 [Nitrospirales bacterium]
MDPVTLILGAFMAAAAVVGSEMVKDGYEALKAKLMERDTEESDIEGAIAGVEKKPQSASRREVLREELEAFSFKEGDPIIPLAQELLEILRKERHLSQETYQAILKGSGAIVQGEGAMGGGEKSAVVREMKDSVQTTGDHSPAIQAGTYINEQHVHSPGVAVAGNVFVEIYNFYQSPSGEGRLTEDNFKQRLNRYLSWVNDRYGKARLWGAEHTSNRQGQPVKTLPNIFISLSLRQAPRRNSETATTHLKLTKGHLSSSQFDESEMRHGEGSLVDSCDVLTLHDQVAIIGGPGSGKSTILSYLAAGLVASATGEKLPTDAPPIRFPEGKHALIPLIIPLRYFRNYQRLCDVTPSEQLLTPDLGTLSHFIFWHLKKHFPGFSESEDFFARLLRGGGCLLMLDGLDEVVSREQKGIIRQQIEELYSDFPGNQILVTAREVGYRENAVFGEDVLRLDVQPLNNEQLSALVCKWCGQLYPGEVEARSRELCDAIQHINSLRAHRDLLPLVNSPLLTTMVVSVKWGDTELPRERAKLYEACVKVILQAQYVREDEARKELVEWGGPWEAQRNWLAKLAVEMHSGGRAGAAVAEERVKEILGTELSEEVLTQLLVSVRLRGGLLEEKAELFQFLHLTFQEFLAARWLAKEREHAFSVLQPYVNDPWWREVFLLIYGIAQVDYSPFAKKFLKWLSTEFGKGENALAGSELAGSALLELEQPDEKLKQEQAKLLLHLLTNPSMVASGTLRVRAGDTLSRLHDPRFREDAWFLPKENLLGFVEIPEGSFTMGSNENEGYDREHPQHKINVSTFYMSRYPVTVARFKAFVDQAQYVPRDPECLKGVATHPVVRVTWNDAMAYCTWLTRRLREWAETPESLATLLRNGQGGSPRWIVTLPSEPEWEKAARGTDGRNFPWGEEPDPTKANYRETGINTTSAVGCFPSGVSPYGMEDMSGNVWEWTRSLHGNYPYPSDDEGRRQREDPKSENTRVFRGGSFVSPEGNVRCAYRFHDPPGGRSLDLGFRVVVSPCSGL